MDSTHRFRIGRLVVDRVARRVSVDGADVPLQPKIHDLLDYLAQHAGRAVSHAELLEQVWGRSVASDTVITVAVRKLRQLLDESGGLPDAVTTLRGTGYRLDAPVEWLDEPVSGSTVGRAVTWPRVVVAGVVMVGLIVLWQPWNLAVPSSPRIALLELDNATGNAELDWARAGATALIAEHLVRRGIEVVSPQQIQQLREALTDDLDALEVAIHLTGVDEVYAPRLLPSAEGFRLEMASMADQSTSPLLLTGSDPASLSLAMAGKLAERLRAPLPAPSGADRLDSPFLNEAYARAFHHHQRGEFKASRELYDYILSEMPEHRWTQYQLAIALRQSGDHAGASEILESLRAQDLGDPWLESAVLTTMGNQQWYAGDFEAARENYLAAQRGFQALGMMDGVASTLANLGMLANGQADYERGEIYNREALAIYRRQGHRVNEARTLHNLGNAFLSRGLNAPALTHLNEAHAIRLELGLRDQAANTLSVIADLTIKEGRIAEGTALLEQVLGVYDQTGNQRGRGNVLAGLADTAHRQGDYRRGRDLASQSLALARQRGETFGIAQTTLHLGRNLQALGDRQGAETYYLEAAAAWQTIGNPQGELVTLAERIGLAIELADFAAVDDLLQEMNAAVGTQSDAIMLPTYLGLSTRARIARGDLDGIEKQFDELLQVVGEQSVDRAELTTEIAQALFRVAPGHPLLTDMLPTVTDWAPRHYPAARLAWLAASSPQDCGYAQAALKQLRGGDWNQELPESSLCSLESE